MKILIKPFKKEEYDRYVTMATKRKPLEKERRTRHNVVYYPWKHEMGKSYFDSYPGMILYHAHCIFFRITFCSLSFDYFLVYLYDKENS